MSNGHPKMNKKFNALLTASILPTLVNQLPTLLQAARTGQQVMSTVKNRLGKKKEKKRSSESKRSSSRAPPGDGMYNVPMQRQKAAFHTLPRLNGMNGVRLSVSFMLPDMGVRNTTTPQFGPQNGFLHSTVPGLAYTAIFLDPTRDAGDVTLNIDSGTAVVHSFPLMYYAPRLSSLMRNFERFRIRHFSVESTPSVGTSQAGNIGLAYHSDVWKTAESNPNSLTTNQFNYIRNIDNFSSTAAWAPRHRFVAIDERGPVRADDLLYTFNGSTTSNWTFYDGDARVRETSQGSVLCAHDLTPSASVLTLRHATAHMVIDLYEMSLAEPISTLRSLRPSLVEQKHSDMDTSSDEVKQETRRRDSVEQLYADVREPTLRRPEPLSGFARSISRLQTTPRLSEQSGAPQRN